MYFSFFKVPELTLNNPKLAQTASAPAEAGTLATGVKPTSDDVNELVGLTKSVSVGKDSPTPVSSVGKPRLEMLDSDSTCGESLPASKLAETSASPPPAVVLSQQLLDGSSSIPPEPNDPVGVISNTLSTQTAQKQHNDSSESSESSQDDSSDFDAPPPLPSEEAAASEIPLQQRPVSQGRPRATPLPINFTASLPTPVTLLRQFNLTNFLEQYKYDYQVWKWAWQSWISIFSTGQGASWLHREIRHPRCLMYFFSWLKKNICCRRGIHSIFLSSEHGLLSGNCANRHRSSASARSRAWASTAVEPLSFSCQNIISYYFLTWNLAVHCSNNFMSWLQSIKRLFSMTKDGRFVAEIGVLSPLSEKSSPSSFVDLEVKRYKIWILGCWLLKLSFTLFFINFL